MNDVANEKTRLAEGYLFVPSAAFLARQAHRTVTEILSRFPELFHEIARFYGKSGGNHVNMAEVYAKVHKPWSET